MRVKVVLGAGVALVAVVVAVLLLGEDQRRSGSNYTPEFGPVIELRGADLHCQDGELVPGETGGLDLLVGTHGPPTPELRVRVTDAKGNLVSSGRLSAGRPQGRVVIPVETIERTTGDLEVCIGTGPGGRTVLYGRGQTVRLAWLRPRSESQLAQLSTVAHRFGLGKFNPFGEWLLVLVVLMLAAAWFVALRLVVREAGP